MTKNRGMNRLTKTYSITHTGKIVDTGSVPKIKNKDGTSREDAQ